MSEDRRVAIVGLGYVGLPLALAFVEAGLDVEGDRRLRPIASTSSGAGRSPIDDIDDERLVRGLAAGLTRRVTRRGAISPTADAIFVCVPTPITTTKDPDLGAGPGGRRA